MIITDATPSGEQLHSFTLGNLAERMSIREIIRARIWQEVSDYNHRLTERFRSLVQPTAAESRLNGLNWHKAGEIDWEAQFNRACEAFESNSFFIFVGTRQADSLDEEFDIGVETEIQFVQLVPLVGG